MFHYLKTLAFVLTVWSSLTTQAQEMKVRIKDISRFSHENTYNLVGYGLVTGLADTGDSDKDLTRQTIKNLLENFNIAVDMDELKVSNTAVVMVTATINNEINKNDKITCTITAIGDAESLTGGELITTPLLGPDKQIWGVAQGAVITGGFKFGDGGEGGNTQVKNHPTAGFVQNGAKILRKIDFGIADKDFLAICLKHPDFTTAANVADAINAKYEGISQAENAATINVRVPTIYREENRVPEFIRDLQQIYVKPDSIARVVFNERTGTIVFGSNVRISQVAITQGSINVTVKNTTQVSQPDNGAFNRNPAGETVVANDQETSVEEQEVQLQLLPDVTTVEQLVTALNALGASARDIMIILHSLKEAGALHAELQSI